MREELEHLRDRVFFRDDQQCVLSGRGGHSEDVAVVRVVHVPKSDTDALLDDRNWVTVCKQHREVAVLRDELPDHVELFARDVGLEEQLDKKYGPRTRAVKQSPVRDGLGPPPTDVDKMTDHGEEVARVLAPGSLAPAEVARRLGINRGAAKNRLYALARIGVVEPARADGKWKLTKDARDALKGRWRVRVGA